MIKIGSVIDNRYEILKEIGRGGMSVVFLAMDNRLNKSLVVKDIRKRGNSNNDWLINSLVAEANMLKKLDHGALPKIYDIIELQGNIYVVMDYIEGESLKEKLQREQRVAAGDVIDWAWQLADVLRYLHTRKPHPIIYRDMKPDNVMLTPEGKIKLIDFGIAREYKHHHATDTTNLGTKAYAAPEQISGRQTDERSDIYSLGVTLYHLVTGKNLNEPPFELKPIRYWDTTLPEGLEHIILKCTQAEPDHRYQSCEELAHDIENINKLTKGYKKMLLRQFSVFLVPALLFIAFSTTAVMGYKGLNNEKYQDYMNLVTESGIYLMDGEDTKAIELLEQAISTVDNRRATAYIELLDIYIDRNELDIGLAKIESYIQEKYGNVHKNDEVLFKLGMTYFDLKKDYQSALKYFQMVDEKKLEAARYYKVLAKTMSSMNVDYQEFSENLLEFEKFNDGLANDEKKIENYIALANIYISYKGQILDANSQTIKIINNAKEVIEKIDNEQWQLKYEIGFEQKLAQAYYSRGITKQDAADAANQDFERAIEHYFNLIDMEVSNQEKEEALVRIGVIYQEMGDISQAADQLRNTIKQFPNSIDAHIKLTSLFLEAEQRKAEGQRNYSNVKSVFNQLSDIEGVQEDEAYKKLSRRMRNLELIP